MTDGKPTLLVADDTLANIEVVDAVLGPEFEILFAADGREALERARAEHPDLVLLDVMMPVMDGFETCERLKADPSTRDIPVIFLTALADTETLARSFRAGGVDYLAKPFRPEELEARVRSHVALKRARDLERALRTQLEEALSRVRQLSGLLPICAHCKKIRDDKGSWTPLEHYITGHSEADFTHGICPDCAREFFPGR
jgi:CheY-like chemotaxis protein